MKHKFTLIVKTFATAFAALFLSSCLKQYYQMYSTQPDASSNIKEDAEGYVYETKDYKISYCFWAEYGNPGFLIENKTDKNIIIDLNGSFFIRNGFAYDLIAEHNSLYNAENTIHTTMTIPAKSMKYYEWYKINKEVFLSCNLNARPRKTETISFTKENTPLKFGYRLTIQPEGAEKECLNHSFYVSKITNCSVKSFKFYTPATKADGRHGGEPGLNCNQYYQFKESCKGRYYESDIKQAPATGFYVTYTL